MRVILRLPLPLPAPRLRADPPRHLCQLPLLHTSNASLARKWDLSARCSNARSANLKRTLGYSVRSSTRRVWMTGCVSCAITRRLSKLPSYVTLVCLPARELSNTRQNPDCLLCPRAGPVERKMKHWPPHDTFLRACKPTEGQGWTHLLCAVFTPELTFTDAARLRLVEGMSTISRHRWTTVSSRRPCYMSGDWLKLMIPCRSVACAARWRERSSSATTARRSSTSRVLGSNIILSGLKFNL